MLIVNQAGDEMFVMGNLYSIKVMKQTKNNVDTWVINSDVPECDVYVTLGSYKDEESAKAAFSHIFVNYNYGERYMQMVPDCDGD